MPADRKCPECERAITASVPVKLFEDLIHKHNFSKDALTSFKTDKTW